MQHVQHFTNHSIPKWLTLACFQGLVCKLVNFKMKQHNAEKRAILLGLWIVRQVAIRSDPRFMSYDSQIELRVTG